MAPSTAIKTSAESPYLKWGQFIVSVVLVPVLLRANDSLEDVKKNQQAQATHIAVLEGQMGDLRALVPKRDTQFAVIDSSLTALEKGATVTDYRLGNLEAWQKLSSRRAP